MTDVTAHHHVPAMGRHRLLPLYDPFQWLLGVPSVHRRLLDRVDLRSGQDVLEIGCGTGNLVLAVARREPSANVVGIDPDVATLARARRKASRAHLLVRFEQAYAEALPYPDASFHHVLSAFMLHHLESGARPAALREVRRVLRPGGSLHLVDLAGGPQTHGLVTRLAHRNPRLEHHLEDGLDGLLDDAGFAAVTETQDRTRRLGRIGYHVARVD